jgi:diketogulonate reductase-like aldo/keto reductase
MAGLIRRQFGLAGVAAGVLGSKAMAQPETPTVKLPDGSRVPALGQGSASLAAGRRSAWEEKEALQTGISLGMTLFDTAEAYGSGSAERLIGRAIAGQRDKVFLVSKVSSGHATASGIRRACKDSLVRLGTDYLDLYLLHERGGLANLAVVVQSFESLRTEGHIRRWGVSNFKVADMEELFRIGGGDSCATNQVQYNLADREIERGLLPWCEKNQLPIMAYSPLGKGGDLLRNAGLVRVAQRHQSRPAVIALAWTIRSGRVIAIPESGSSAHVRENASAMSLRLTEPDLHELSRAFS